jgi:hypothetical protein
MTQSAIITKLERHLDQGIRNEAEAVYLMVEIRKLLEQQDAKKRYEYLTFHCDWALHAKLTGSTAQRILKLFDAANVHLKTGVELEHLPDLLRMEIERISKMHYFERELESFLKANGLPTLRSTRADGWIHFLHLYTKIVEDSPLGMTSKNSSATIASVTLQVDLAKTAKFGEVWFQVRWVIQDKNGRTGQIASLLESRSLWPFAEASGHRACRSGCLRCGICEPEGQFGLEHAIWSPHVPDHWRDGRV